MDIKYRCAFSNCIVNHIMVWRHFLLRGEFQILKTRACLVQIDIAESPVEEDFAREQPELEPQLVVVDGCVAAQIQQSVVEISQRLFEIPQQEVRHAFLEVRNGEILITADGALVAFDLSMLVSFIWDCTTLTYCSFMLS